MRYGSTIKIATSTPSTGEMPQIECSIISYEADSAKGQTAKQVGLLLSSHDNVAILGKTGAGKSTYLQFIALTFAQAKAGERRFRKPGIVKERFGMSQWYLPVYIPLRKIARFIRDCDAQQDGNLCFEAFRQEVLPSHVRDDFSDSFISKVSFSGSDLTGASFDGANLNDVDFSDSNVTKQQLEKTSNLEKLKGFN